MAKKAVVERVREHLAGPTSESLLRTRNISVIAHVDHGKSTLSDSLVSRAGLIAQARAGDAHFMSVREDEKKRTITIKSASVSLVFDVPTRLKTQPVKGGWSKEQSDALRAAKLEKGREEEGSGEKPAEAKGPTTKVLPYLVNLIDSPGHVDFSSEVTAALRVTDGALVLVDCIEGVCVQTETVLRQALGERIRPVLFLNKLDRIFAELDADPEEAYQALARTVESVNVIISLHQDAVLDDQTVWPQNGSVGFGSGLLGFGFTLGDFAQLYAGKFDMSRQKLMKKLWGDHYWDPRAKRWLTTPVGSSGKKLRRGFVQFVLDPLRQLFKHIREQDHAAIARFASNLNIVLPADIKERQGRELARGVLQAWLPAADALLDMIVHHLPSPPEAQRYRADTLYAGPMDDEAARALRSCDPNGPLMLFVTKMVPSADRKRFFAFGRVFSGTVRAGQQVRILGPGYVPGSKTDLTVASVQGVVLMMGPYCEPASEMTAGNMVGLSGIDQHLQKTGTITTLSTAYGFQALRFSVAPIVRVAVSVENPAHLSKLNTGLRRLAKSDGLVQCYVSQTGEHIVAGCGELHLEVCLKDLREDFLKDVPLRVSQPVVSFCETVTEETSTIVCTKSPNKHNRLYMTAQPLGDELTALLATSSGSASLETLDAKTLSRRLVDEFKWEAETARKVWTFGLPVDNARANALVDLTKGVSYLQDIRDAVCAGFQQVTQTGVFTGEPLRGVRFNLIDCKIHRDPAHRGDSQLGAATRRAIYGCQYKAAPRLLEPLYLADITVPQAAVAGAYSTLRLRRAVIRPEESGPSSGGVCKVQAYLPVIESFGFTEALRKATGGQAFPQLSFWGYALVKGDLTQPEAEGNLGFKFMTEIRKRKGLPDHPPPFSEFHDQI